MADWLQWVNLDTAIIAGHPGGSGVTKNLSLNNLAAAAARQSVKFDLGADFHLGGAIALRWETGTAPTAGGLIKAYLVWSIDDSIWPSSVDGTDSAFTAANENLLGAPAARLPVQNTGSLTLTTNLFPFKAASRYGSIVVVNSSSQASRNQGTPANNTGRVYILPHKLISKSV